MNPTLPPQDPEPSDAVRDQAATVALRTSLTYALCAGLWVLLSDRLLALLIKDAGRFALLGSIKGVAFVVVTAGILYYTLRASLQRLAHETTRRQRAEGLLGEGPDRLRLAARGADVGLWHWDLRTNAVHYSPEWKRQIGYEEHELANAFNEWQSRIHPEDLEPALRAVQAYLANPAAGYRAEFRLRHKDGSYRWIQAQGSNLNDEQGKPARLLASHLDITGRKQAEELLRQATGTSLRQHSERARRDGVIIALLCVVVLLVGHYFGVFELLAAWVLNYRNTGLDEVLTVLMFLAFALLVYSHRRGQELKAEMAERSRAEAALGALHGELETRVQQRTAELSGANEHLRAEIAGRKQAEQTLRESQQRMELLMQSTDEGIYGVDLEGRCTFINRAGAEMFGCQPEEVRGRNIHELVHHHKPDGASYPAEECPIYRAFHTGEGSRVDTEVFWRRDGTFFPVEYSSHPIREGGVITGAVATFNDISARKKLEAQFLRAQRMESIGALAGGIAHDLNNALAPIVMASEFLKITSTKPEDGRVLDTIIESANRGAGMVKQILTFARGTEGERGLVQPKHLVKGMIDIARHSFPKSIQIHTDVAADTGMLLGNPTQFHQILLNLCVNARDAMPTGGTLTLATSQVRLSETDGQLAPDAKPGPYVLLTVSDTGTGMPPEVRARIFDAFFTTKEPGKGTGLGLSTVQNIVKDHGGFLTVESEVGKGTTFKVYLPAQEPTTATAVEAAPPALPMGKGELILVVDDEAAIRSIAKQTLQAFGYRVVTANDGAQAVGVCAQQLSDLQIMITDMAMPIMDGQAAIRAVRILAPRLKVVAASGSDSLADSPVLKELDVQAFLRKPFSADDLIRTVHEVLHSPANG